MKKKDTLKLNTKIIASLVAAGFVVLSVYLNLEDPMNHQLQVSGLLIGVLTFVSVLISLKNHLPGSILLGWMGLIYIVLYVFNIPVSPFYR